MSSLGLDTQPSAVTYELDDLIIQAWVGGIRVPHFQRDFRWGSQDVIRLFDSIARGFPGSTFPRFGSYTATNWTAYLTGCDPVPRHGHTPSNGSTAKSTTARYRYTSRTSPRSGMCTPKRSTRALLKLSPPSRIAVMTYGRFGNSPAGWPSRSSSETVTRTLRTGRSSTPTNGCPHWHRHTTSSPPRSTGNPATDMRTWASNLPVPAASTMLDQSHSRGLSVGWDNRFGHTGAGLADVAAATARRVAEMWPRYREELMDLPPIRAGLDSWIPERVRALLGPS